MTIRIFESPDSGVDKSIRKIDILAGEGTDYSVKISVSGSPEISGMVNIGIFLLPCY